LRWLVAPILRSGTAEQNHHRSIEPDTRHLGVSQTGRLEHRDLTTAARLSANAAEAKGAFAVVRPLFTQRQMADGLLLETANGPVFLPGSRRPSTAERRDFRFNRAGRKLRHLAQSDKRKPLAQLILV